MDGINYKLAIVVGIAGYMLGVYSARRLIKRLLEGWGKARRYTEELEEKLKQ